MSIRAKARLAGVFYLLTFASGALALSAVGMRVANLFATACYIPVTVLFYDIFKPVSRRLSLLAACFSLAGCAVGALASFHLTPIPINSLAFFGVYCLLIGLLIVTSGFMPQIVGVLMMIGGAGWLTFASSALARALAPYNFVPGIFAEGVLTVWLLVFGVTAEGGQERASPTPR